MTFPDDLLLFLRAYLKTVVSCDSYCVGVSHNLLTNLKIKGRLIFGFCLKITYEFELKATECPSDSNEQHTMKINSASLQDEVEVVIGNAKLHMCYLYISIIYHIYTVKLQTLLQINLVFL